jgi:transposase
MARPSKCTEAVAKKILAAIRAGNFREVAAEFAGIDPGTLMRWMKRKGEPYRSFRVALLEAERASEVLLVKRQMRFAEKDVKANQFLLERKFPERWGRRDRLDMTVKRADLTCLSDDELRAYLAIQEKLERAQ